MSLSAEQIAARKGKMTGSRVGALMSGDVAKIDQLYKEFIGEIEPENLDHVWAVRLGACTEQLQLDWLQEQNKIPIVRRGEVVSHPIMEWAACTLDGWICDPVDMPVECKHTGGFEPTEIIVDRYQPQLQWTMMVTGADSIMLSIIKGAAEPMVTEIKRAEDYIKAMTERANAFMLCVALRTPPVEVPAIPPPVEALKVINMTGNNQWADAALSFITLQAQAQDFEMAKKVIKSLVPEDAARAFGHGIKVTRDRRGALHIREED